MLINYSSDWSNGEINISPENIKALWIPDVIIHDLVSFTKPEILTEVAALEIYQNKHVYYKIRSDITIVCRAMQFGQFPLDSHKCYFLLSSFGYDDTRMVLRGKFSYDKTNQRALSFNVDLMDLPPERTLFAGASSNYSMYGFEINLSRSLGPFILSVYLPSAMFVMMSWVSFFIPPDVVPARIVLLVTLCLVLINMFNSTTTRIPVSNTVTALEVWLLACMLLVFLSLLEYAVILRQIVLYRRKREKDGENAYYNGTGTSSYTTINYAPSTNKSSPVRYFAAATETDPCLSLDQIDNGLFERKKKTTSRKKKRRTNSLIKKAPKRIRSDEERLTKFKNTLDRGAFLLFPLLFVLFNSIYWTLYLTVIITRKQGAFQGSD
ncbi:glycine receptor subunit alpha-3 [Eurytemora carolleeae]|uniref:glycine receptor subunit alpha-3 n=1 Tax=Eurytemora carolleeae TaxID=1294199 RepID=UPI000C77DB85|nr:glycine receptor subunit alpha-3 [Eurytemora carolleeae]|eukprot:XP_023326380.1 glycine receptor subunit alpha-3-like [Eurytemora affinis]